MCSDTEMEDENENASSKLSQQQDALFRELMQACRHSAPGARLSARLRTKLERLSPTQRRDLVSRTAGGCAPLFIAARRGNSELVEYLVHVCGAPLEQRGLYEAWDERAQHKVTPLWCAAVAGCMRALIVLADAGASVDACSDSGSTPVRSACFMSHEAIVRELVARGADIHKPNHNGGTCLINSVQCHRLCAFLLEQGADVNACDLQKKTALHYACQEQRAAAAALLLRHGADPRARSRAGQHALGAAATEGASEIVSLLLSHVQYSAEEAAEALELLGATHLDELNDLRAASESWRRATILRYTPEGYIEKRLPPPVEALGGLQEWRTMEDLTDVLSELELARCHALLVAIRILGPTHRDTVRRLMFRGASYADTFRYQKAVQLWTWTLELRIQTDTILYTDTWHTAAALTRLMLDAVAGRLERMDPAETFPKHQDVKAVFSLVADALPAAQYGLKAQPMFKKQADTYDRVLRCITHLIYLLMETADSDKEREETTNMVGALLSWGPRSAHTGDSLLHLAASRLNVLRSTYFADEISSSTPPIFPNVEVVQLLTSLGADVRALNQAHCTPLHVAAVPYNYSPELIAALLDAGGHLDQMNRFGDSPLGLIETRSDFNLNPLQHITLACLASRAVLASPAYRNLPKDALPSTLHEFLNLHRP